MTKSVQKWWLHTRVIVAVVVTCVCHDGRANPAGMTVQTGQATASQSGPLLNVNVGSANAFLTWQSFNIARGETTRFNQPSAASIVWNRINDPNPTQIFGHLDANGVVVLANQSGFYFGPDSFVKAAGFIATTANLTPEIGLGSAWNFTGMPPLASIINYGQMQVESGGSLFLIAEKIRNNGILTAPDGTLGLYAGKEVLVSERPDGRGLSAKVTLPSGSVDNEGQLIVDAGTVALHAQVVNQGGLIQANSVREVNGTIELVASDTVSLGPNSTINAAAAGSDGIGGQVVIQAGKAFEDAPGSRISVAGGQWSGNGGSLEISAPRIAQINSTLDGRAASGYTGGKLLLDPDYLRISATTTPNPNDPPGTTVVTPLQYSTFANITLQANLDITQDVAWTLPDAANPSTLRMDAGRNIQLISFGSIVAGQNWNVELVAGANLTTLNAGSPINSLVPGAGSITLNGYSSITAQNGFVHLYAGKDVLLVPGLVGTPGSVNTLGGGSIDVLALSGDINTGRDKSGYTFSDDPTAPLGPTSNLGGISTGLGGDVKLVAGGNITSYLPTQAVGETDAGSGAFGSQPGNVTVKAGGTVTGHFVVGNGQGLIQAGLNAGTSTAPLALSLIKGSWEVDATQNINLQEVRDSNSIFNGTEGPNNHTFLYDPADSVVLNGGNSVTLSGLNLPLGRARSPVYPPSLAITAGAGGISVQNALSLYPSPNGQLSLTTTAGGSLQGGTANGSIPSITLSDSASTRYNSGTSFGPGDHANTLLHANDTQPVQVTIAGDIANLNLVFPKPAQITVGGNLVNTSVTAQNLRPTDQTTIAVAGDIKNRSDLTFYSGATESPNFDAFAAAFGGVSDPFNYDPVSRQISFLGRMTAGQLSSYLNLQVPVLDISGAPVVDSSGNPIYTHPQFMDPAILNYFYNNSQDVPQQLGVGGYFIKGPGKLLVSARNVDLGVTPGIVSSGPLNNPALAAVAGGKGADIILSTTGDLNMYASAIASEAGGNVAVTVGGSVNLGAPDVQITTATAAGRGIYTAAQADVSIIANGDINVQGSRVAAYDGGNVLVRSLNGNINAGNGGLGAQDVQRVTVDPVSGQVIGLIDTIPGSGILATSFPEQSANPVGNITVEAPRGSINGGLGGIVQLSLNGNKSYSSGVSLSAGSTLADGTVIPGDINLNGSGVIAINIDLKATGNITGNAVASQNINIVARENVSVSALGGGNVNVSASGTVSGTIVGVGSVSASGANVEASLLSQNVQGGAGATTGQTGFSAGTAANAVSTGASAQGAQTQALAKPQTASSAGDDDLKKKKPAPVLVRRISRVTVILPGK